jgi:hypothetical protein
MMRYSLSYRLTVAGGLCALIAGMAAIDTDVRKELTRVMLGEGLSPQIASIGWRLREFWIVGIHLLREQSVEHSVLVMFGLGATVILLFLLRIRL